MAYWLQSYNIEGLHFLVVDPSDHMGQLLTSMLRVLGVRTVTCVHDGSAAIDILSGTPPDILLTEIAMAPMDGIEMIGRIRNNGNGIDRTLPVIVVSSYTEKDFVQRARDAGMDEFLAKPVSVRALYRKIVAVIEKRREFVKASRYFGPDRRRHHDDVVPAPHRRRTDTGTPAIRFD